MSSIPYPLDKIRAIAFDVDGVLSPSTIPMSATGQPLRMVNIKDGYALQLAVKCGLQLAIITGGTCEANEVRYSSLGVQSIFQGVAKKLPVLQLWMESMGLKAEEVAYVGDDIPDYEAMQAVGLSVAPADSAPEIKEIAVYISPVAGGYGVARDLLEQVLKAQGHWMTHAKAFGW
ncbi:MAG: HAD hydrolase family protein [Bacteroidales bacterium]|nr:HAD hydrolase family protein [Bacteroidales bacterium]